MNKVKHGIKRLLAGVAAIALAAVCMALPAVQAQAAEGGGAHSIFSIDAGRKYFSADQLKQIIDRAAKNGYTDVQLILANDGMRFFLDDMSIETDGRVYESDAVKAALTAGNDEYYKDPNGNALTEAEMNDIISYAKSKGIGIVPVINSPGHMDALLVAMKELGIENAAYTNGSKVSDRTVDITNEQAVNFLYAVLQKYISYFGEAGVSEYFNFGADEFANDVFTNPGWGEIQSNGTYRNFVEYANHVSGLIKAAGMKPVCFNDGIYYNSKTNFGTFDQDITVSYWTSGWWGFDVAKPEFLQQQGLDILNTNDGWYWVLGRISSGGYNFDNALKNIAAKDFNDVTGANGPIKTIGSMQCVWCDEPSKPHDMDRIFQLMDKFSEKNADHMPKPADYTKVDEALATVPEDLSIYTPESRKAVEDAVAAVKRGYKADKQAEVDKMAADINAAIDALAFRPADYSAVDAALARVPKDLTGYTDATRVTVQNAVASVKRGYTVDKQADVDAMAAAINAAVDGLVKKPVVKPEQKPSSKPVVKPSEKLPQTGDPVQILAVASVGLSVLGMGLLASRRKA
ncbi:family 20 glycosylhydrolase [Collinsella stercoris]|uniref:family 20 glycosylhydrolase n=1 Tax=Collinsella stercoris TaxID=147206 RepID=UPI00248DE386|nr:family 20 glycosylhydrolase [Collinsella stercoris]